VDRMQRPRRSYRAARRGDEAAPTSSGLLRHDWRCEPAPSLRRAKDVRHSIVWLFRPTSGSSRRIERTARVGLRLPRGNQPGGSAARLVVKRKMAASSHAPFEVKRRLGFRLLER
jgi:hypothetical protein